MTLDLVDVKQGIDFSFAAFCHYLVIKYKFSPLEITW